MISLNEIEWLAGYLEGEGSFGYYPKKRVGGSPRITVVSTDYDVISRVAEIFCITSIHNRKRYNSKNKQAYMVSCVGVKAASWGMTIYSMMGKRRKEQISGMLYEWRLRPAIIRPINRCGHPERAHSGRYMCRYCYNMWKQGRLHRELHPDLPSEVWSIPANCWPRLSISRSCEHPNKSSSRDVMNSESPASGETMTDQQANTNESLACGYCGHPTTYRVGQAPVCTRCCREIVCGSYLYQEERMGDEPPACGPPRPLKRGQSPDAAESGPTGRTHG